MPTWTTTSFLTPKQPAALPYRPLPKERWMYHLFLVQIYTHRFMTSEQLLKLNPTLISSGRAARSYTKRLREANLIDRLPSRIPGNPLHVHYVTPSGVDVINELELKHNIKLDAKKEDIRRGGRTVETSSHDTLATDFQISLETDPALADATFAMVERRYHRDDRELRYTAGASKKAIQPDIGMLVHGSRKYPFLFVELDAGTKSTTELLRQINAYYFWWMSAEGRKYLHDAYTAHGYRAGMNNFRLLVIFHVQTNLPSDQEHRLHDLLTHVLEIPEDLRRQLWLAEAYRLDGAPLTEQLWLSPGWFTWLGEYEQFQKGLPTGERNWLQRHRKELEFIRERVQDEPRLALLYPGATDAQEKATSTER